MRALGYDKFATEVINSHSRRSPLYDLVLASREQKAVDFFSPEALAELYRCAGTQFDPEVVDAFARVLEREAVHAA